MGTDEWVEPSERGEVFLDAGKHYELRVFHWHPDQDRVAWTAMLGHIEVHLTETVLAAVTSTPLEIDSPYDLKTSAFRASDDASASRSATIVLRITNSGNSQEADQTQPELVLPIKVRAPIWKLVGATVAFAFFLWLQQYIALASRGPVGFGVSFALFGLTLLTAAFAVLAIRKPF